jgi:hypothetical protein
MNPLRFAILIAFVGTSLWTFSLYIPVQLGIAPSEPWEFVAETRSAVKAEESRWPDVPRSANCFRYTFGTVCCKTGVGIVANTKHALAF